MRASAPLLTLLVLLSFSTASAQQHPSSGDNRLPVPRSSEQAPVLKAIRAKYKFDNSKYDTADQLAVSKQLRQEASTASQDPVKQYVLLREARELAVNAGNFDAAFGAIDDTANRFIVDPNELKVSALADAMDRSGIPKPQLMDNYLKVSEDALSRGDVQMAFQASRLATMIARRSSDPVLVERAKQVDLRVHDARRELTAVIAAANKLKAHPDDADASLAVGRYLCFVQGRWQDGLPLLARGSDQRLRELAEKDTQKPKDAAAMADLADAWWNLPDTKQTPHQRSRQRAAYWYEQALSGLSGDKKARAEQRIAEAKRTSDPN